MNRRSRVLLFDFDGTISLGDGPVARYAQCVADCLGHRDGARFVEAVAEHTTIGVTEAGMLPRDGYDAVRLAAASFGVSADALARAYRLSRADLAGVRAPIDPVPGLARFLGTIREHALLVLATNSPPTRIPEALHVLGLQNTFDEVLTSVGKPDGLGTVLERLQQTATDGPLRLLSIGDIWVNDLQPAALRGFQTALIGPSAPPGATPTYRAERLDALFPVITAWLSSETPGLIVPIPHLQN
ncbi:HAD family hydrolase [Cryobacterium frigoriphilum]|uniref:HAD family hydrolase n=1 Tax=Cryobacterium frigoriphilum TaxID=1259150 RepID=A0A4V3IQV6_9MICO|nr:HAD family hydrolase [Cryobacterium frigoriphilum]TFD48784.1 HAD family hydrolase [Cryobacterium frigoriphilum]